MPPFQSSARWKKLLETNETPLQAEVDIVRTLQEDAQNAELVLQCKTILSPSRRVPPEIIAEIIKHALGHYTNDPTPVTLDTAAGPWPLSHVNGMWRDVILSQSRFWTSISVGSEPDWMIKETNFATGSEIMSAILDRSGDGALFGDIDDRSPLAVDLIIQQDLRWKHLELHFQDPLPLCTLNGSRRSFPVLEYLSLDIETALTKYSRIHGGQHLNIVAFEFAPLLHSVTLPEYSVYQDDESSFEGMPWEQITSYEGPMRLSKITRRLSALESANFKGTVKYNTQPRELVFPNVRSLTVAKVEMLDVLTLPAVHTLDIDIQRRYPVSSVFQQIIDRSECSIRTLTVHDLTTQVLDALWVIPTVTHLWISADVMKSIDLIYALVPNRYTSYRILFPSLQFLTMKILVCGDTVSRDYVRVFRRIDEAIRDLLVARLHEPPTGISRLTTLDCDIRYCCDALRVGEAELLKKRFRTDPLYSASNIVMWEGISCSRR